MSDWIFVPQNRVKIWLVWRKSMSIQISITQAAMGRFWKFFFTSYKLLHFILSFPFYFAQCFEPFELVRKFVHNFRLFRTIWVFLSLPQSTTSTIFRPLRLFSKVFYLKLHSHFSPVLKNSFALRFRPASSSFQTAINYRAEPFLRGTFNRQKFIILPLLYLPNVLFYFVQSIWQSALHGNCPSGEAAVIFKRP